MSFRFIDSRKEKRRAESESIWCWKKVVMIRGRSGGVPGKGLGMEQNDTGKTLGKRKFKSRRNGTLAW